MTKKKEFKINDYRYKKLKDKYLLTTNSGSFLLLDEKEFNDLKDEKIDRKLFDLLEEQEVIITPQNQKKIIERTRQKYWYMFKGTSLHIVVPTLRCNMKCLYCQASSVNPSLKGYDMDSETAKKTVDFIFQTPSEAITIEFQGGEPLLNFEIVKYITKYAKELNKKNKKKLKLSIVTNFNALDEEKLDFLINEDINICTSLDGPKFIHDFNRPLLGNSGSYDSVIRWINIIRERYKQQKLKKGIGALITVTKKCLDYPKAAVDEYIKDGFNTIHLRPMSTMGCASASWQKIGYKPEDFIDFWKKSMDYIFELNKKGIKIKERMSVIILRKILGVSVSEGEDYVDLRSPCGAAIGQLLYNYNGNIFTCDEGRMVGNDIFKIGDVNQKYKDVLTSKQTCAIVSSSINDSFICNNCVYKPYCGICPVCNYFEQGNIIAKIPETSRCKTYMAMFDYLTEKYFFDENSKVVLDRWVYKKQGKNNKL